MQSESYACMCMYTHILHSLRVHLNTGKSLKHVAVYLKMLTNSVFLLTLLLVYFVLLSTRTLLIFLDIII